MKCPSALIHEYAYIVLTISNQMSLFADTCFPVICSNIIFPSGTFPHLETYSKRSMDRPGHLPNIFKYNHKFVPMEYFQLSTHQMFSFNF